MLNIIQFLASTVKSHRLERLEKIDISLRANFYLFTVKDIKVSFIDINHVGNVVYHKHMHAPLN